MVFTTVPTSTQPRPQRTVETAPRPLCASSLVPYPFSKGLVRRIFVIVVVALGLRNSCRTLFSRVFRLSVSDLRRRNRGEERSAVRRVRSGSRDTRRERYQRSVFDTGHTRDPSPAPSVVPLTTDTRLLFCCDSVPHSEGLRIESYLDRLFTLLILYSRFPTPCG